MSGKGKKRRKESKNEEFDLSKLKENVGQFENEGLESDASLLNKQQRFEKEMQEKKEAAEAIQTLMRENKRMNDVVKILADQLFQYRKVLRQDPQLFDLFLNLERLNLSNHNANKFFQNIKFVYKNDMEEDNAKKVLYAINTALENVINETDIESFSNKISSDQLARYLNTLRKSLKQAHQIMDVNLLEKIYRIYFKSLIQNTHIEIVQQNIINTIRYAANVNALAQQLNEQL